MRAAVGSLAFARKNLAAAIGGGPFESFPKLAELLATDCLVGGRIKLNRRAGKLLELCSSDAPLGGLRPRASDSQIW